MWSKLGIGIVLGVALTAAAAVWWGKSWLHDELAIPAAGFHYELSPGGTLSHVANDLRAAGVLRYPRLLTLYARLTSRTAVKAGEYQLGPHDTPLTLLGKLNRGDVITYLVTIVEGWTFQQALVHVQAADKIHARLLDPTAVEQFLAALELTGEHPEGWFFPDTYRYVAGTTDREIMTRAHRRMHKVLTEEWRERASDLPYASPYEALIMASIVERETGLAAEREQIAGVFVRRLKRNMRLQTDPTVIYGLGQAYDGNIRRAHLAESTPYNTYLIRGLPPTPIALPGREAIYAALHPDDGEALYFVAKGDGSHYFSTSLEEHNQAVRRFQVRERAEDYQSAPRKILPKEPVP